MTESSRLKEPFKKVPPNCLQKQFLTLKAWIVTSIKFLLLKNITATRSNVQVKRMNGMISTDEMTMFD